MFVLTPILGAAAAMCERDPNSPPCKDFLAGPPDWVLWMCGVLTAAVIIATVAIFVWERRKRG